MVIITLNILKKKDNSNLDKNKIVFDINLYDKEKFDLKETDDFLSSTNSEQIFKENTQLFNNYGKKK
jgi:arsenate reductase-like glutaredoxin family protein